LGEMEMGVAVASDICGGRGPVRFRFGSEEWNDEGDTHWGNMESE
jgi:hypothetical protein